MKKVLLICGAGASSGFMAGSIRKAAKKRKYEISVKARSETELEEYINEIDILLIGPHLAYKEESLKEQTKNKNIKVAVIPQAIYGALDGNKALDLIIGE
ncbi:PTS lactose transporter subunit IIB [Lentibacillus populi]|uniref:PTS lactose transporter subunit IIB n=1 Tax=Lentibacillus populi TaxID=1827502 RepID=A0A9W5TWV7_9BACI|nr:PTS sugar transporter subunit IIB [Lentibacillus populi]GGB38883.1 PTS lactose transporter subunit IIB [Lentibacillus populi]